MMHACSHILVVDGNPYVRELVGVMLETRTCRISGVADAHAMHEFIHTDDTVDLVIMDCSGNRSSSMALHLKQLGIPLVIMSANPAMTQFAVENGLQLVGKPFRAARLRAATEAAVPPRNNGRQQDVISTS
jgi:DNA-binding NtrC family response regulator